jgi:hypothetical protein
VDVEPSDHHIAGDQKELITRGFREPSDGLEPSTPSLPCAPIGNWWQLVATGGNGFGLFWGFLGSERLPLVATGCARLAP